MYVTIIGGLESLLAQSIMFLLQNSPVKCELNDRMAALEREPFHKPFSLLRMYLYFYVLRVPQIML